MIQGDPRFAIIIQENPKGKREANIIFQGETMQELSRQITVMILRENARLEAADDFFPES